MLYVLGLSTLQALAILIVALVMGVSVASGVLGIALVLMFSILLGLSICCLSMALAFTLHGHAQFFAIVGFVGLPLIFASIALAPLSGMPAWLQVIAKANPMTYTITASRSLILDGVQPQLLLTTAVPLVVFAVLSMLACLYALTRAVRRRRLGALHAWVHERDGDPSRRGVNRDGAGSQESSRDPAPHCVPA